jgi:uncharacterized protein
MSDATQLIASDLHIYPIKSCAGLRVDQLSFAESGLIAGDREWVVIDADSEVIWQGSHPRLCLVSAVFEADTLALRAPNTEGMKVPLAHADQKRELKIWNEFTQTHERFEGHDEGDAAADFLSAVVDAPVRLVRLDDDARLRQGTNHVHLLSLSSLAELNDALEANSRLRVSAERFRPNIMIAGDPQPLMPFIEESFVDLQWGAGEHAVALADLKPCVRCVVPNVDPASGRVADEPLLTLTKLSAQRHPGKPVYFGIYAKVRGACLLKAGAALSARLNV